MKLKKYTDADHDAMREDGLEYLLAVELTEEERDIDTAYFYYVGRWYNEWWSEAGPGVDSEWIESKFQETGWYVFDPNEDYSGILRFIDPWLIAGFCQLPINFNALFTDDPAPPSSRRP